MSKLGFRISRRFIITASIVTLSLALPLVAFADQVVNNIDSTIDPALETRTITAGGSTVVGFYIQPSNTIPTGDASGCNATGSAPATVTLSVPVGVTATPSVFTFTGCGSPSNVHNVTFSSSTAGSYTISVASVTGGKSGSLWDTAPAAFTLNVSPPADTTPPVITPNVSGTAGSGGWYVSDVTVSWTVTDPESTISSMSGCGTTNITADTSGTNLTCTATSAGGTNSQTVSIMRDATPPAIGGLALPAPNSAGWNNGNVTVSFTCSDLMSGIVSCGPNQTLSGDGAAQSVTGTAVDAAGNSATATVSGINIDKTAPGISGSASPGANANGWNNSSVAVAFNCSDALSGVASCGPNQPLSGEGAGQWATGSAVDNAGNSATATVSGINIDLTPPTISGVASPAPNGYGWNNTAVNVAFACADALSGVDSCGPDQTLTGDGAAQSVSGLAVDLAGNSTLATVGGINIDMTPPTISGAASPAPNAAGWNKTDVTVTFTCGDALSGVASCGPNQTLSSEGTNQSVSGTVWDMAGNTDSATVGGINIDKTAPVVNVTGVTNNAMYVLGSVPAAGCDTADALSGVAVPATLNVTGGNAYGIGTFTATCSGGMDNAGNMASASVTYSVIYNWAGFFRPADNLPVVNIVKAGSAIPVKFSLGGNFGLNIFASGYPRVQVMTCNAFAPADLVEETVTAGGSSLSFDPLTNQYVYVWKTDRSWGGQCRQLVVVLNDGTYHRANFNFTR